MHLQRPYTLVFLVLLLLSYIHPSAAQDGLNDASGSSGNARSGKQNFLSRFRKTKSLPLEPSLLDRIQRIMKADEYAEMKPIWDHAVRQNWIHPHSGFPVRVDTNRAREESRSVRYIMSKLDPYIERLGGELKP
ncbi:hypothetical protein PHBOTO_002806 [Pseudozyma hubeiensis]|nr:hypothetical protein PHBOTO_002806 [Pseudozyma hubeiensis]